MDAQRLERQAARGPEVIAHLLVLRLGVDQSTGRRLLFGVPYLSDNSLGVPYLIHDNLELLTQFLNVLGDVVPLLGRGLDTFQGSAAVCSLGFTVILEY